MSSKFESATTLRRPALQKLTDDLGEMRRSLLAGFDSRPELLRWTQKLTVKTLGQVPQRRYQQFGEEFIPDSEATEGTLVSALLTPRARSRRVRHDVATELRQDWASRTIGVARHPAFRQLRKDAGDYVGETEDDRGHDPSQRYTAMRPGLDELHEHQRAALNAVLQGGLKDRGAILDWGDTLELATHGEPVDPDAPAEFVMRCFQEDATANLLTSEGESYDRARQAFAAKWLLPAMNRGVCDLVGRTNEEPNTETSDDSGGAHL